jgi:hypothetical protein
MPVEIRDLTIKVTVNSPEQGGGKGSSQSPAEAQSTEASEDIIAAAVEQMTNILQNKTER